MKILGKRDMILAAAILLIAAAVFGFNYVSHRTPAATAQISVDGKVVEILDLSKDTELTVCLLYTSYNSSPAAPSLSSPGNWPWARPLHGLRNKWKRRKA